MPGAESGHAAKPSRPLPQRTDIAGSSSGDIPWVAIRSAGVLVLADAGKCSAIGGIGIDFPLVDQPALPSSSSHSALQS
jgi:hypothetical protein